MQRKSSSKENIQMPGCYGYGYQGKWLEAEGGYSSQCLPRHSAKLKGMYNWWYYRYFSFISNCYLGALCKGHCTLQVVHGIRSGYTGDFGIHCAVTTVYNALNVSAWMNLSVTWGWYNFNQKPDNWKLKTKNNWKVKTRKTWDVVVGEHWEQKYVYIP